MDISGSSDAAKGEMMLVQAVVRQLAMGDSFDGFARDAQVGVLLIEWKWWVLRRQGYRLAQLTSFVVVPLTMEVFCFA